MGACAMACAVACGSAQGQVVPPVPSRALHVVCAGHTSHVVGPLDEPTEGFMLIRVPRVMGDRPKGKLGKAKARLGKVGWALGPLPLLVVRVLLDFVPSAVDYIYEAMPPHP